MSGQSQGVGVEVILVVAAVLYAYNRAHSAGGPPAVGTGPLPPALPPSATTPGWHPPLSLNPSAYLYGSQAQSPFSQMEQNTAFASPGHAPTGGISGLNLASAAASFAPAGIGAPLAGADAGLIAARNSSVGLIREPAKFLCSALAIFGVCKGGGSAPKLTPRQASQLPSPPVPGQSWQQITAGDPMSWA